MRRVTREVHTVLKYYHLNQLTETLKFVSILPLNVEIQEQVDTANNKTMRRRKRAKSL